MLRSLVVAVLRLTLRIFFRRVELSGAERLPATGPLLLVLNHPNSLVDPVFLLCLSPRPVAFLAKAPLFRVPLIGALVRATGSIPVERRQDPGADLRKNREMFGRVREHLAAGGAIALFPEGTSHSDPRLKPLKTGAARIALGVQAVDPVRIQPVGLFYTDKRTFRSGALVYFGEPFAISPAPLDADGEPPAEAVEALTARIGTALGAVTLQADEFEAHDFVARTERILASQRRESDQAPRPALAEEFGFRRRILAGYHALRERDPARLDRIRRRIYRYEDRLRGAGVDPWNVPVGRLEARRVAAQTAGFLTRFLILLPLGLPGLLLHYLPYRLVGVLSRRAVGKYEDILATAKAAAGFIVFPLTWIAVGLALGARFGRWAGLTGLLIAPWSGYAALRMVELADRSLGALRLLLLQALGPKRLVRLQVERRGIREEVLKLAEELGV